MLRCRSLIAAVAAMIALTSCRDQVVLPPPVAERGYVLYDQAVIGMTFPTTTDGIDSKWAIEGYPPEMEWYLSFDLNVLRSNKLTERELLQKLVEEVRTKRVDEIREHIRREKGTVRFSEFEIYHDCKAPAANDDMASEFTTGIIVSLEKLLDTKISTEQILKEAALFQKPRVRRSDWKNWYPAMVIAHHKGDFHEMNGIVKLGRDVDPKAPPKEN